MTDKLEAGYYKDDKGNRRYWDGEQWLVPDSAPAKGPLVSRKAKGPLLMAVGLAVVMGGGYWAYSEFSYQQKVQLLEEEHGKRAKELGRVAQAAVSACEADEGFTASTKGLIINTMGNENPTGATYDEMACVLEELNVPDGTMERVGATNSLQGLVEASWKAKSGDLEIEAEWNYHPDPGMTMTLTFSSPYFEDFEPPER